MKKVINCIGISLLLIFSLQTHLMAQNEKGDIKVGGGLIFGSGVGEGDLDNSIGINAGGYYSFDEKIRAGANFKFYFPDKEGGAKLTVWELNFNGNYIFVEDEGKRAYGLAGINITSVNFDFDGNDFFGGGSASDSEFGLNLGIGGEYDVNFGSLYAEIKYIVSDADQLVIGAGVRFPIN